MVCCLLLIYAGQKTLTGFRGDCNATSLAKLGVDRYAYRDYPQWALAHNDTECPDSLLEVAQHMGKVEEDTKDPWGTPYKLFCGRSGPRGPVTLIVVSFGEDQTENTADDIRSWEPRTP